MLTSSPIGMSTIVAKQTPVAREVEANGFSIPCRVSGNRSSLMANTIKTIPLSTMTTSGITAASFLRWEEFQKGKR